MTEWRYSKTQRIRNYFKRNQEATVADVCEELGLDAHGARTIIARLARDDYLEDTGRRVETPGHGNRKAKIWRLKENANGREDMATLRETLRERLGRFRAGRPQ